MTPREQTVFNAIINCPSRAKENNPSDPCYEIINYQRNYISKKGRGTIQQPNPQARRQVPEPWNGDLANTSYLILASNPAYVPDEVFPNRDTNWASWADFGDGSLWTNKDCEDFFEGRLGKAICPRNGQLYFDLAANTVLSTDYHSNRFFRNKVQNNYWITYDALCDAISPYYSRGSFSFAITDLVHCKSGMQIGVSKACKACIQHTRNILDLFTKNGLKNHSVLLIGSVPKDYLEKLFINYSFIEKPRPVGSFLDSKKNTTEFVYEQIMSIDGISVSVYFNIPAPSGMNRSRCPVTINGKTISW